MIKDLCNILKDSLIELSESQIITHIAGLTTLKELKTDDGKIKKFPLSVDCISNNTACEECKDNFYLVPAKEKRCIVYFEGGYISPINQGVDVQLYESQVSLICWYNSELFVQTSDIQTKMINQITNKIRAIGDFVNTDSVLMKPSLKIISILDSDTNIFSKYTYDNMSTNYLGCPFNFFKINLNIKFSTNEKCNNNPLAINNYNSCQTL